MNKANIQNQKLFIEAVESGKSTVTVDGTVVNNKTSREIGYTTNQGYKAIGMKKDGKARLILVHRLVYLVHKGNLTEDQEINHIDGNKLNNHISNLEAVSLSENVRHAYRTGLHDNSNKIKSEKFKGHKGNAAKLSEKEAVEVRELFKSGKVKAAELAKQYGIHRTNVYRIARGETYSH